MKSFTLTHYRLRLLLHARRRRIEMARRSFQSVRGGKPQADGPSFPVPLSEVLTGCLLMQDRIRETKVSSENRTEFISENQL